ncbi:hypothetical protein KS4_23700 [Poriferisphaera corsica]|uniref:Uncharacterized protein n=1 Tax=Poriferisphaera corsica TaxID=2528020 RepID=A0A517YVS8_9BACT|nr:hypothetical protein [Poriferisphaera corsica]QDU34303.1 hypothetical protein KS4_23700 [Poriferisphaera corsica]
MSKSRYTASIGMSPADSVMYSIRDSKRNKDVATIYARDSHWAKMAIAAPEMYDTLVMARKELIDAIHIIDSLSTGVTFSGEHPIEKIDSVLFSVIGGE